MIKPTSALASTPSLIDPETAEPKGIPFSGSPQSISTDDLMHHFSPIVTAVMVDAEFFLRRVKRICGELSPEEAALKLHEMALLHLNGRHPSRLYRIFVYDAPPAEGRHHTPLNKRSLDFSKSDLAIWRRAFHEKLRGLRKVALRMGELHKNAPFWQIKPEALKELIDGTKQWSDLKDSDFRPDIRQKGVDMRLGLDIASLAFKRQVNQIILVSGDADFVPAAKLARREGVDFILDPMGAIIRSDLHEHIDGLRSVLRPKKKTVKAHN
jgi:uncharacterized LabA/DUF88 family protein